MKMITFADDCKKQGEHVFDRPFTPNCELEFIAKYIEHWLL